MWAIFRDPCDENVIRSGAAAAPCAKSRARWVLAATILAFGRAMGETMAVAMLIGNSPRLNWSLLSPGGTLAGLLANQFGEAKGLQISALMYAALALVLLTLLVNVIGEAVLRRAQKSIAGIR